MNKNTINVFLVVTIISLACEKVGKIQLGKVALFPMLFAVVIGMILTPDLLGKKIQKLREIIGEKEMKIASQYIPASKVQWLRSGADC